MLLAISGVLNVEEACGSLFVLIGLLQSNVIGVPVNDSLVTRKVSGFAMYVTVFMLSLLLIFSSCIKEDC